VRAASAKVASVQEAFLKAWRALDRFDGRAPFEHWLERRLAFALRLDPQQRQKVHEILVRTQGDLKSLRSEFQPRFVEVVKRAETQISADLTPGQQRRFEKFQQDNRAWWPAR
jgi:DNA-directed RNA polymerase specialized sigma24 family protein